MALALPNKDPEEDLDYSVSFQDLIPTGTELSLAEVEIEEASPTESPFSLMPCGSPYVVLGSVDETASPLTSDLVTFWVTGGTLDTKYTLKVTATGNETGVPCPRKYVRRVTIKIKEK